MLAGEVDLVMNTPRGPAGNSGPRVDGYEIRTAAVAANIPCLTTVQAAAAAVQGIEELIRGELGVRSLQDLHAQLAAWRGGRDMSERARRRRRRSVRSSQCSRSAITCSSPSSRPASPLASGPGTSWR